ncbi:P-loop containing nucleoside triphosphate hydrolase protein [Lactarius sanguifluus]|nr:P-loop containing nucleoside triphosphate hydrolase protein [Lactarius sanguifluus]
MATSFFQARAPAKKKSGKEKENVVNPSLQPWVEKYRPETIDDVSSQEHIVSVLRKTLSSSNLPHMLFYGPPGTGKTSTILALARQLFGPDNFRSRVLELNASDERGISIVREKVKNFARQTPRAEAVASDGKKYPCPPYKIIILDEADSMTQDAQAALRRIMENYARITRFCLVCNYVTRIIEPLASRCSKFRFKPLDSSSARQRLEHIALAEKVPVNEDADLRRAVTYLQSAARLSAATEPPSAILPQDIQEIAGVVPDAIIRKLAQTLGVDVTLIGGGDGDVEMGDAASLTVESDLRGFDLIRGTVRSLIREGYSASQVLSQLHDVIVEHPTLTWAPKALCDGADEELWILEVALRVHKAVTS